MPSLTHPLSPPWDSFSGWALPQPRAWSEQMATPKDPACKPCSLPSPPFDFSADNSKLQSGCTDWQPSREHLTMCKRSSNTCTIPSVKSGGREVSEDYTEPGDPGCLAVALEKEWGGRQHIRESGLPSDPSNKPMRHTLSPLLRVLNCLKS